MSNTDKPLGLASTEVVGLVPERAEFESWAKDQGFPLETLDGFCSDAVAYRDLRTQGAWEGFSVGVAAERERCAATCREQAKNADGDVNYRDACYDCDAAIRAGITFEVSRPRRRHDDGY